MLNLTTELVVNKQYLRLRDKIIKKDVYATNHKVCNQVTEIANLIIPIKLSVRAELFTLQ